MKKLTEYTAEHAVVFAVGGLAYGTIEMLFRGHTHWTMLLTGGACFAAIYAIERRYFYVSLWKRCLAGSAVITATELVVGCIVNLALGWRVWDYSERALNIFGQICPLYSVAWMLLCIPATSVCRGLRNTFFTLKQKGGCELEKQEREDKAQ